MESAVNVGAATVRTVGTLLIRAGDSGLAPTTTILSTTLCFASLF